MRILLCPGQGSQSEGFLNDWISNVPGFETKLRELSEACGKDLLQLGTTATEEEIKDTSNAQPLIVGASIAAARTALNLAEYGGVVGHSVGEFAAAALSGVITDAEAMKLVAIRAEAMANEASKQRTSMAAVLGGDPEAVVSAIVGHDLSVANYNGAGQLVAAGAKDAILQLVANPPEKTRVVELKVAGAFHTHFMSEAVGTLGEAASAITAKDPQIMLWSNADGQEVSSGAQFLASLVSQVSNPVRWDKCMETIDILGATLVELPPAGALAGLAKRGMPNSSVIGLKLPADVEKIGA